MTGYIPLTIPPPQVPLATGPRATAAAPTAAPGRGIVAQRALPTAEPAGRLGPLVSFRSGCDAPAGTSTSSDGGPALRNVAVHLLFWGSQWNNNPSPAVAQVALTANCRPRRPPRRPAGSPASA